MLHRLRPARRPAHLLSLLLVLSTCLSVFVWRPPAPPQPPAQVSAAPPVPARPDGWQPAPAALATLRAASVLGGLDWGRIALPGALPRTGDEVLGMRMRALLRGEERFASARPQASPEPGTLLPLILLLLGLAREPRRDS